MCYTRSLNKGDSNVLKFSHENEGAAIVIARFFFETDEIK